jgi:hypothetical protein
MVKVYILTDAALKKINTPPVRRRIMDVLGVTEFTIARYIQKKSDNLLKKPVLDVIMEMTGLKEEEIYSVTEK